MFEIICIILKILSIVVPLLISVAYFTIAERKLMGSIQRRRGPNVIGFTGLLQPLADGLKLFVKETILPSNSNIYIFLLAPLLTFILSLIGWSVIPISETIVISDLNLGILYLFAVSSLSVYGIIMAGWSSNSKYPFLGSLRSAAQMISYEAAMGLALVPVILYSGSLSLVDIVDSQSGNLSSSIPILNSIVSFIPKWNVFPQFVAFGIFFIAAVAEVNRAPFDLVEAEQELVGGFHTEYSGFRFAMFFLAEYLHLVIAALHFLLFFSGG